MDQERIREYIGGLPGVDVDIASKESGAPEIAWGDTFFIYDPDRNLQGAQRFPFATIVTKDYGDFDNASNLNRPGIFRLNIGVSKRTFDSLFESKAVHDFTALDRLMPHPVYGRNHWVSVLNPSAGTFEDLKPLLKEAYDVAVGRRAKPRPRAARR
ncbi:MAG TPA: DUF6194 family protein [Candidatus Sulfotelmatobacter sp.]|nr:DUF6194 family protein [Candidatus Sulfotelmatobacter sp.]